MNGRGGPINSDFPRGKTFGPVTALRDSAQSQPRSQPAHFDTFHIGTFQPTRGEPSPVPPRFSGEFEAKSVAHSRAQTVDAGLRSRNGLWPSSRSDCRLELHLLRNRLAVLIAKLITRVAVPVCAEKVVTPVCHPRRKKLGVFVSEPVHAFDRRKARIPLFSTESPHRSKCGQERSGAPIFV